MTDKTWVLAPDMNRARLAGYINGRNGVHVITPRNANTAARGARIHRVTTVELSWRETAELLKHRAIIPATDGRVEVYPVNGPHYRWENP